MNDFDAVIINKSDCFREAVMKPSDLLNTLDDLSNDQFDLFKWFLQQVGSSAGLPSIRKSPLQTANRQDTVDLMVQTYRLHGAVQVTRKVLQEINRNDLLQSLSASSSGPAVDVDDVGECSKNRGAPSSQAQVLLPQTEDLMIPVPEPQPVTFYQRMLQSNFQDKFMCAQEGWAADKQLLVDIYADLYVTAGCGIHINTQHEVRQVENVLKPTETEKLVKPRDIFKHPSGEYRPIRTVLTNGIAGIGKTFLVQKFVLDWAEQRSNQDVHLIFPFSFRQLNLLKEERFSLAELVHECIPETVDIRKEALNYIFTCLQSSGNSNHDRSKFKLLFVFDGLDESRLHLDLHSDDIRSLDVTKSAKTDVLLKKLINGKLLRSARIWITTRPAAANQIPREFISSVTEVRGFTEPQKEEYFRKRFGDEEQANKIISYIKTSRSLHIMCHIPVFCWISATVLEDVLKTRAAGELPRTLTEMYSEFLVFQIDQTKEKYGSERCLRYIKSLAKLAFQQLEKGNLIFYEKDLMLSDIEFKEASVCSGVFTEIFKEERGKKDRNKLFSFVHLSVQEFLAAVHVRMSLINNSKNVKSFFDLSLKNLHLILNKPSSNRVHRMFIDKALQSPNGHLDLFLRFLLGLSLQTNQDKLKDLLINSDNHSKTNQKTVQYIKHRISENLSVEKSINLFHCLSELNDHSLVEEIQQFLSSGSLSTQKLSPAQWSALVFILLSSEDLEVFDLKRYSASEEALLRLLPVLKAASKALLDGCNLTQRSCEALSSLLVSESSGLTELDLNRNNLQDSGVKLLFAAMESPHCKLEKLGLQQTNISDHCCQDLSSLLVSQFSGLRELDLSNNNLKDSGVALLLPALESSHCLLETFRLNQACLTETSCQEFSSVLSSARCRLTEMDLSNNDLRDLGVTLLSAGLESSHCSLRVLRLSACMISDAGCASLASALRSNPSYLQELDLSYNHPGAAGAKLLSARLEAPSSQLKTLRLEHGGPQRLKPGLNKYFCELTLDQNMAHRKLKLSDSNRKATSVTELQAYPDHPERFHFCQLLCCEAVTARGYWEVEWTGVVHVALSYRGVRRRGTRNDCLFGRNDQSWTLSCSDVGYSVCHDRRETPICSSCCSSSPSSSSSSSSSSSNRVAVYVDHPAGVLSFYRVSSDSVVHLYTFRTTFSGPLYAGFGFLFGGSESSASLCRLQEESSS
ncbi:NACHT, LRR and PYD domains-containing protein 3 isoform X2 [Kryptolebias marmoratus]|uniref:NACHT, LRR and PYD domains-containing protein 3 isoform X2 n=1 Tax=Kryptolebias marmoratus TaxID=37003 RepID=UPI0007F8764A|nr:NACHT, LRR and PYD domains-containing protein 3 isoform X2 [Kryptolebias marmoratus]